MYLLDTFVSIESGSQGLYKDNGSRFIAFAYPVETPEEAMSIVSGLKKEYHDARHHCFAYRLGMDGGLWRANDDGEPSGSAGRPILSQIDSAGLSDILVVVVRYFGGVKLGIPGLIRAYKTSTSDALANAVRTVKTASRLFRLEFTYSNLPQVMKAVKDMGLEQSGQDFGEVCRMDVRVRLSKIDDFFERIEKISNFKELN